MDPLTILAFSIPISVLGAVIATRFRRASDWDQKVSKKRIGQYQEYIGELEEDIKTLQSEKYRAQRGPKANGNESELDNILPSLIPQFASYAPNWLKPLLKDENLQKYLIDFYKKNPEKATRFLSKVIGKSSGKDSQGVMNSPESL